MSKIKLQKEIDQVNHDVILYFYIELGRCSDE